MTQRNRRPPDGVVFDYDGVLLRYWPRGWKALPEIFERLDLAGLEDEVDINAFRKQLQHTSIGRVLFAIIPKVCELHGIAPPSKKRIIGALIETEITHGPPQPIPDQTREALQTLHAWRNDPSHHLQLLGILSNRSYTTAMHHMMGAQEDLFHLFDVMQFSRSTWSERWLEKAQARLRFHSCDVLIQKHRKPDPQAFDAFIDWMKRRGLLRGFSPERPFVALYVGDTSADFEVVTAVNLLLAKRNASLRFVFIPACIGGPILNNEEWAEYIEDLSIVGPFVRSVHGLNELIAEYHSGSRRLPNLP